VKGPPAPVEGVVGRFTVAEVTLGAASSSVLKFLAAGSARVSFGAVTGRSCPAVLVVSAALLTVAPVVAAASAEPEGTTNLGPNPPAESASPGRPHSRPYTG
jgi:hypothetical protein